MEIQITAQYCLNKWIECLSKREETDEAQPNGIMNGRMGRVLLYAILYRYSGRREFEYKAQQVLEHLVGQLGEENQLNFGEGLAGIGWGIEWLAQNKFIDVNTDEILLEVEDEIYKSVVFQKSSSLSIETGVLGRAVYFYKRYISENHGTNRLITISNLECLILLIDEMKELLLDEKTGILRAGTTDKPIPSPEDLENIAHSLIFVSGLERRIYPEITKRVITGIVSFINSPGMENRISQMNYSPDQQLIKALLKLSYSLYVAGDRYKRSDWREKGIMYFGKLVENRQENILDHPVIGELLAKFYRITGTEKYLDLLESSLEFDRYLHVDQLSFRKGAGIFLTLMRLREPGLPGCDEVLLI